MSEIRQRLPDINFVALMSEVAKHFWGEPNKKLSKRPHLELRWGSKGSKTVNVKAGTWFDYERWEGGGCLDLIQRELGLDRAEGIKLLRSKGFLEPTDSGNGRQYEQPRQNEHRAKPNADAECIKRKLELWPRLRPIGDTLSERYLRNRRIELTAELLNGTVLRHDPNHSFGDDGRHPALIGLFRTIDGDEPRAIHRTALLPDGSDRIREKNSGWDGRRWLGPVSGCAIKLCADETVESGLAVAEGVETALTAICHYDWRPCWACGSAGLLRTFPVLNGIDCLTIFPDHDKDGIEAAEKLEKRWLAAGRECHVLMSLDGDWNDVVRSTHDRQLRNPGREARQAPSAMGASQGQNQPQWHPLETRRSNERR